MPHFVFGQHSVWLNGYVYGKSLKDVAKEACVQTQESLEAWLNQLDGHFRIVLICDTYAFAAVDPIRSYPILFSKEHHDLILSASGSEIETFLNLDDQSIDPDMALSVAMSGFTIGEQTLYRQVKNLNPGHYLFYRDNQLAQKAYHIWKPWIEDNGGNEQHLSETLASVNETVIDKLIEGSDGRPILVPLSAGLDSRFIASGLKAGGYENVTCVAYGLPGNREAQASRAIAQKLGYKWIFVPYTNRKIRTDFLSDDYQNFKSYCDNLTGVHFPQDYSMVKHLVDTHQIDADTIVVNGQSGDFITGNHIPKSLLCLPNKSISEPLETPPILEALIAKHFRNWASLQTSENISRISEMLIAELAKVLSTTPDPKNIHGLYEFIEFQDRQSKYVVNGQRCYEYMNLGWRLPLWCRDYLDFWEQAPESVKASQNLYKTVLYKTNWGNVWHDIPINESVIQPAWIRPVRFLAKAIYSLDITNGRKNWHRFEKRFIDYWTTTTCAFAAWPYQSVAMDQRGHYTAIAWHIADYLESKGMTWDGRLPPSRMDQTFQ
jgi:asparagine synthase (glutamine-hydrolysing)